MTDYQSKFRGEEIDELLQWIKDGGSNRPNSEYENQVLTVTFDMDFTTFESSNFSHTATEIVEAFNNGKVVQGVVEVPSDIGVPVTYILPLISATNISGTCLIAFGSIAVLNGLPLYVMVQCLHSAAANVSQSSTIIHQISTVE